MNVECDNCDWSGAADQLRYQLAEVPDLLQRIDPGGQVPAGECPECGALAYPIPEVPRPCEPEPARPERDALRVRNALIEFCTDIDQTGDPDWIDLADTYRRACTALGRPVVQKCPRTV